jgi:hypothetical protein
MARDSHYKRRRMTPLLTNPFNVRAVNTENFRRLVKYLKLVSNSDLMSRDDLIGVLCNNGYIKLKFKLAWE